uniref:Uncharacterized protein n=1 Tax=Tetradesmus obliquus TaxID=3088 RepID=A0A383W6Q8_TETOB|eukprot:jgi/Sobl393_1/12121/SZX72873.1
MSSSNSPAAADGPGTSNGTGVFIPACILDGSALSNPAIMSKPHRKRRGSGTQAQSEPKHGSNGSKASQKQQPQQQAAAAGAGSSAAAGSSAVGKNPFAATPKNIRQQQLLCNLVAAADCFSEAATPAAANTLPPVGSTGNLSGAAATSRSPSLDLSSLPAAALVQQQQQALLAAAAAAAAAGGMARAPSFELTRSASRASLDSSCYHYPRSSVDMASSARTSVDQSCRSSMDRCSSSYGRPSTESTFSCYGRPSAEYGAGAAATRASYGQQQQQQMTGVAVGRRTALDLGHRPVASPAELQQQQQRAASMELARRMSLEVAAAAGSQRISLDNSECNAAWQHWQQQQHAAAAAAAHAAPRRDASNVSCGSTISSCGSLPSPGLPADTAGLAAQQALLLQLQQQLLLGRLPNSNAAAAALAGQSFLQDAAAAQAGLMLRAGSGGSPPAAFPSPSAAAGAGLPPVGPHRPGSGGNSAGSIGSVSSHAHEVNLIQAQLQQAMQASHMAAQMAAAAAAGQAASQQQVLQMLQAQRDSAALQQLLGQFSQEAADLSGLQAQEQLALARMAAAGQAQCSSLDAEVSAASLQQQLEMLQMLQL